MRYHCPFTPGLLIKLHERVAKTTRSLTPRNVAATPGPLLSQGKLVVVLTHCPLRRRAHVLCDGQYLWIRAHHFSWREVSVPEEGTEQDADAEMASLACVAQVILE